MQLASIEIEQNVDGGGSGRGLGTSVRTICNCHRHFHILETTSRDLIENLRGMGHPILPQLDLGCPPSSHRPQTVMSIAQVKTGCHARKPSCTPQEDTSHDRNVGC